MKVIAYTALHYGSPYLPWAIRSIIDHVNEYYVLYSPDGSHSHKTDMPLPQSESCASLYALAKLVAGDKLRWIDGDWTQEGEQRDAIHEIVPDADVVLVLDYDEIWQDVGAVIERIKPLNHRYYRLPMVHFWRSFRRCVLHDPALPHRIICPKREPENHQLIGTLQGYKPIAHMGYAIPDYLMQYKRELHGHKNEFRTDIDWFAERWCANAQRDCHPVGSDFWTPEEVNPAEYLPDFMRLHPYWTKDVIE